MEGEFYAIASIWSLNVLTVTLINCTGVTIPKLNWEVVMRTKEDLFINIYSNLYSKYMNNYYKWSINDVLITHPS